MPNYNKSDQRQAPTEAAMDASTIDQADLDRLTDKDKQDLRQFIQNEQQRTRIQARMRPNPPLPRRQLLLS